jgi:hypothetical protein
MLFIIQIINNTLIILLRQRTNINFPTKKYTEYIKANN